MQERHKLDMLSLVFGLLFIALAVPVLVTNTPLDFDARWMVPVAAIAVGVVVAVSALRRGTSHTETGSIEPDPAVTEALEELPEVPDLD